MTTEARPGTSPYDDERTAQKRRAARALGKLLGNFAQYPIESGSESPVYKAVAKYREAVLIAGEVEVLPADRQQFLQDHLTYVGVLDGENPEKAARQFVALSEGVELNQEYWSRQLQETSVQFLIDKR